MGQWSELAKQVDGLVGRPEEPGPGPADEREHFYTCSRCGQLVDRRDLAAVFHHEDEDHEPLAEEQMVRMVEDPQTRLQLLGRRPH